MYLSSFKVQEIKFIFQLEYKLFKKNNEFIFSFLFKHETLKIIMKQEALITIKKIKKTNSRNILHMQI